MKNILKILFFIVLGACRIQEPNPIEGIWSQCLEDGTYKEFVISSYNAATTVSKFQENADTISLFKSHIQDSLLIITEGITGSLMNNEPETIRVESITYDKIIIKNKFNAVIELSRIENKTPEIDPDNLSQWRKLYLDGFIERAKLANCPDMRTEEEKNEPIELGILEDEFENVLLEFDTFPKWAKAKLLKYKQDFAFRYKLGPTFIEEDFTGDGSLDIAIFVNKKSNGKDGILFFLSDGDSIYLAGAGNSFGQGGDNFDWVYSWEVFEQSSTGARQTSQTDFVLLLYQ